jgi:hypothetical protein
VQKQPLNEIDEEQLRPVEFTKLPSPPGVELMVFYAGVYEDDDSRNRFGITAFALKRDEEAVQQFTRDLRVQIRAADSADAPETFKTPARYSSLTAAEDDSSEPSDDSAPEVEITVTVADLTENVEYFALSACTSLRFPHEERWVGPEWVRVKVEAGKLRLRGVVGGPYDLVPIGGYTDSLKANGECFIKGMKPVPSKCCFSAGWHKA